PPPPETYTRSLHDALPIWSADCGFGSRVRPGVACAPPIRMDERGCGRATDLARGPALRRSREWRRGSRDPLHGTAHRPNVRVARAPSGRRGTRCIASADGRALPAAERLRHVALQRADARGAHGVAAVW